MTDQAEIARLNAELASTWRVTGWQLSKLYARMGELRAQINALEAVGEAREIVAWLDEGG